MPIGLLFWILMVLWFFSWVGTVWGGWTGPYAHAGSVLFFVLLFLLGWHDFGFVIRN